MMSDEREIIKIYVKDTPALSDFILGFQVQNTLTNLITFITFYHQYRDFCSNNYSWKTSV